jgi:hypothetical protein
MIGVPRLTVELCGGDGFGDAAAGGDAGGGLSLGVPTGGLAFAAVVFGAVAPLPAPLRRVDASGAGAVGAVASAG